MQFFLPNQKIWLTKHEKGKRVFSLVNAGWIASRVLDIFLNINQINQLVYLTMKLLLIIFMLTILTGKNSVLFNPEIKAWQCQTFLLC